MDDGPTEADIAVDAALGDLVRCAYHDRWLQARLQDRGGPHQHPMLRERPATGDLLRPTAAWTTWKD